MFPHKLTRPIAISATAIAIAGGAYGIVSATAGNSSSTATTATSPAPPSGRPALGRRGSGRNGRQHVHVESHAVDISGAEGDRQQGVLYDVPDGDKRHLGDCNSKV